MKQLLFLLVVVLMLSGCTVSAEMMEDARVTCEQNGFEDTSNMKVKRIGNGNYSVNCFYSDEDRYNDLSVEKIGEDTFNFKK